MKIFYLFFIFLNLAFALPLSEIQSTMTKDIDVTMQALQKQDRDLEKISKEIFATFDDTFDYSLMAQLSLSSEFKKLSDADKAIFIKAFEENLKKSFVSKLRLYKDEKIKVLGGKQTKANRYNLKTSIILDGQEKHIVFKFYDKKSDWKIYDVDILGISVIQTYRSQFSDILKQTDFQGLLQKLKDEIQFDAK